MSAVAAQGKAAALERSPPRAASPARGAAPRQAASPRTQPRPRRTCASCAAASIASSRSSRRPKARAPRRPTSCASPRRAISRGQPAARASSPPSSERVRGEAARHRRRFGARCSADLDARARRRSAELLYARYIDGRARALPRMLLSGDDPHAMARQLVYVSLPRRALKRDLIGRARDDLARLAGLEAAAREKVAALAAVEARARAERRHPAGEGGGAPAGARPDRRPDPEGRAPSSPPPQRNEARLARLVEELARARARPPPRRRAPPGRDPGAGAARDRRLRRAQGAASVRRCKGNYRPGFGAQRAGCQPVARKACSSAPPEGGGGAGGGRRAGGLRRLDARASATC